MLAWILLIFLIMVAFYVRVVAFCSRFALNFALFFRTKVARGIFVAFSFLCLGGSIYFMTYAGVDFKDPTYKLYQFISTHRPISGLIIFLTYVVYLLYLISLTLSQHALFGTDGVLFREHRPLFFRFLAVATNYLSPFFFPIFSGWMSLTATPSNYETHTFYFSAWSFVLYINAMVLLSMAFLLEQEYGAIDMFVAVGVGFGLHFHPGGLLFLVIFGCQFFVCLKNFVLTILNKHRRGLGPQQGIDDNIPTTAADYFKEREAGPGRESRQD